MYDVLGIQPISIHAPSRERQRPVSKYTLLTGFQSSLPHGSDTLSVTSELACPNFNPRSLTGATVGHVNAESYTGISIHAPLRERRVLKIVPLLVSSISIHAPLRERLFSAMPLGINPKFQSTLPYGSDIRGFHYDNLIL